VQLFELSAPSIWIAFDLRVAGAGTGDRRIIARRSFVTP
jgi:hypothetical protein